VENATLKDLIRFCYQVTDDRITGGPKQMDDDRFDVVAKPESRIRPEQALLMMQGFLADRFQLTLHRESKEVRVYQLIPSLATPIRLTSPRLLWNGRISR
jgi:uncharacterized protein (TIGR03435 family)